MVRLWWWMFVCNNSFKVVSSTSLRSAGLAESSRAPPIGHSRRPTPKKTKLCNTLSNTFEDRAPRVHILGEREMMERKKILIVQIDDSNSTRSMSIWSTPDSIWCVERTISMIRFRRAVSSMTGKHFTKRDGTTIIAAEEQCIHRPRHSSTTCWERRRYRCVDRWCFFIFGIGYRSRMGFSLHRLVVNRSRFLDSLTFGRSMTMSEF